MANVLKAVSTGQFFPAMPAHTLSDIGIEDVLRLIERGFPAPTDAHPPLITTPNGATLPGITCDPDGPLVAEVIRTTSDPFAGRLSMVRVFSGTLRSDDIVHVSGHRELFQDREGDGHDEEERVGLLSGPSGVELQAPKTSIAATHLLRSLTDLIELLPSAAESGGEAWQVFVQRVAELQSASGDAS